MPDYHALSAVLAGPTYAGPPSITDEAAETLLNAPGTPIQGIVGSDDLLRWGASTGVLGAVQANLTNTTAVGSTTVGSLCYAIQYMLISDLGFDTSNATNLELLAALATVLPALTSAAQSALMTLGQTPGPSIAVATPGWGIPVTSIDVNVARSLS